MSHRPLQRTAIEGHDVVYNYATLSIARMDELQAFMDQLVQQKKLSDHETFQSYIKHAHFQLPEDFAEAKSIVVFALYTKLMKAAFHHRGAAHDVLVPPQYYGLGLPKDAVSTVVRTEILPSADCRLERLAHAHLKLLAVRSGLARYGRNNISYVEGMGSFITLAAFVTDCELPDQWTDLGMLPQCEACTLCLNNCPTGAIRADEFVIDAGKCLPLYNEVPGDFPAWLPADVHNAFMGCMRCQLPCPANRAVVKDAGRLPDIGEEETQAMLAGLPDAAELTSAGEKLRIDLTDQDVLQVSSRNLNALLSNRQASGAR